MADKLPRFEDTLPVTEALPQLENTVPVEEGLPKFEDTVPLEKLSGLQALIVGGSQGITAGFADEILGFVLATKDKLTTDDKRSFAELYRDNQQLFERRVDAARSQHPWAAGIGEVIGGIVGLGTAGTSIKGATALGATYGVGASKGQLVGENADIARVAVDATLGGGLGLLGGAAFKGVGMGVSKAKGALGRKLSAKMRAESFDLEAKVSSRLDEMAEEFTAIDDVLKLTEPTEIPDFTTFSSKVSSDTAGKIIKVKAVEAMPSKRELATLSKHVGSPVDKVSWNVVEVAREEMAIKGIKGSAIKYAAHKMYEAELRNMASYVAKRVPPKKLGELIDPDELAKANKKYLEAFNQGKINLTTYKEMKAQKIAIDILKDKNNGRLQTKFKGFIDPAANIINRKIMDLRYMFSEIDNVLGTELGVLGDDMYAATNRHTVFSNKWLTKGDELIAARTKAKVAPDRVRKLLTDSELPRTPAEQSVVTKYEQAFSDIIKDPTLKEQGIRITAIKDYAPQKPLEMFALAQELKKWSKESSVTKFLESKKNIYKARKANTDLDEFIGSVENVYGQSIQNRAELQIAIQNLDKVAKVKTSLGYEVSATFARKRKLPDRLLLKDIDVLFTSYVNNVSKGANLAKPIQAMDAYVTILREAKMNKSANYLQEYLTHMSGIPTGLGAQSAKWGAAYRSKVNNYFNSGGFLSNVTKEAALIGPELFNMITHSIYPNFLGFNVRATLRNYTQPFAMTGMDIGTESVTYGLGLATKATGRTLALQAKSGSRYFQVAREELTKRGLAPAKYTGEGAEALRSGLQYSVVRGMRKLLKKQEEFAMVLYTHSDYQNRMVTMYMAEDLVKDLLSGASAKKLGQSLTKNQTTALNFIQKMEPGYRSRMKRLLLEGKGTPDEIQKLTAQYLIAKTQLVYGKVGMNEFGRQMGPLFSMFTKWPTTVASEVITRIKQDGQQGAIDVGKKYLAPILALGALDVATDFEKSPRGQELIGSSGPTYYAPGLAAFDITDFMMPPVLSTGKDFLTEIQNVSSNPDEAEQVAKRIATKAKRAAKTYLPGAVWYNTYNRFNKILTNEEE